MRTANLLNFLLRSLFWLRIDWISDRRCARGHHDFKRRDLTIDEFLFAPHWQYGACSHCGVQLRRPLPL